MRRLVIAAALLTVYAAVLVKVMVLKDIPTIHIGQLMLNFAGRESGHPPNLVPFRTIVPYLMGRGGLIIAGINIGGNIGLLVPVGFLIPLIFGRIGWKGMLAVAVGSGLAIETMQTLLDVGIFDIDDVILNALGVTLGYCSLRMLKEWMAARSYVKMALATASVIAACGLTVYAVYPKQPLVSPEDRLLIAEPGPIGTGRDLCRGTGGTGKIVSVGEGAITIERRDGATQRIMLTRKTEIKSGGGPMAESALMPGDHVTVVVDRSETASVILLCAA